MLLVNTDSVQGKEMEILGLVSGVGVPPVKVRWTTAGMGKVIEEGVERANQSMIEKARALGANAIVKVFYDKESSEAGVRIMVWGTAVMLK
ncbi:MAG: heavy metal-binding domain-containing protein [Oscillospiraceae bacterium]|nr:heavy metal-binding domain-containing protein [Oscillospiraceae bacterium]